MFYNLTSIVRSKEENKIVLKFISSQGIGKINLNYGAEIAIESFEPELGKLYWVEKFSTSRGNLYIIVKEDSSSYAVAKDQRHLREILPLLREAKENSGFSKKGKPIHTRNNK